MGLIIKSKMMLNDNDRQRIEQAVRNIMTGSNLGYVFETALLKAAEYATIYEREQQAPLLRELEEFKMGNMMDEYTVELSDKVEKLEAERSEVRNKVIEECIAKVNDRYGERISKATLIELLNSLKTK